uniref:StAR-related lipid transfer (START) domain containing 13a n=1 Tax=Astyanax mexicanus TaxID=7994 RepID=A0A8B9GUY8_ASTMX
TSDSKHVLTVYSQFPIDISAVKKDHDFLDRDLVEPLCRRLNTLNKCAPMKLDVGFPKKRVSTNEDSDEDDLLAISSRWTFERSSRRWSRLQDIDLLLAGADGRSLLQGPGMRTTVSSESVLTDLSEPEICSLNSEDSLSIMPDSASLAPLSVPRDLPHYNSLPAKSGRRGRTRAKDFLRRMETLGRSWAPSVGRPERRSLAISGPILQSQPEALKKMHCVPIVNGETLSFEKSPSASNCSTVLANSEETSQLENSGITGPDLKESVSKPHSASKRAGVYLEDLDVLSGVPQRRRPVEQSRRHEFCSYDDLVVHIPKDHKPGTFPKALSIESLAPASGNTGNWRVQEPERVRPPRVVKAAGHREQRPVTRCSLESDGTQGWGLCSSSSSQVGDGSPLRRWRVSVEVEAPPCVVLNRVLRERHLWDSNLLQGKVLETLDKQTEVYQYAINSMAPHPSRDFVVLRTWRTDMPKGACVLVSVSIDHEDSMPMAGVRGVVLESQYLLEKCGSGKSRLTHICRVDLKGKSLEWYNKAFGHLCAAEVASIRNSFQPLDTEGPETKI